MFIYKAPLVFQSRIEDNKEDNKTVTLHSCWLYSASIARCSSNEEAEFLKQKEMYLDKFRKAGFSDEELEVMIKQGVSPEPEVHQKHLKIMGLTKKIKVCTITGSFSEYMDTSNQDKRSMVNDFQNILKENGPLIIEYPSMGFMAIHRSAITGVILGKNSQTGEEEIFLISNDTMDSRLKAVPLSDMLELVNNRGGEISFFTTPEKRAQNPQLYTPEESIALLRKPPENQWLPSLKGDLALLGMDTVVDLESMTDLSLNPDSPKAVNPNNPNAFFATPKIEGEKKKLLEKDSDSSKDDPNCCPIL